MTELWQLYDEQGRVKPGQGASKNDVYGKGLLHGAVHVWIWRIIDNGAEVLLQKRASDKTTWPNYYDISAAGHIDLGEDPVTAALRETIEEIGLGVNESDLKLFNVHRAHLVDENGAIENEFQWQYLLKLTDPTNFHLRDGEVASLEWKSLTAFGRETRTAQEPYVPHGRLYFQTVIAAIAAQLPRHE